MTKQESFKRRVRERMAKTGERYGAARRVLHDQADARRAGGGRTWAAQPDVGDEAVAEATGRCWDAWCDVIDAWPGHDSGHRAVAAWLQAEHDIEGWWAQSVTGGWERITGRRLPYQRPDGTFTASKSRTVTVDADQLRRLLLDDGARAELFPGHPSELRSRPSSKTIRLDPGAGIALIALDARHDGRTTVSIEHGRLPSLDAVEEWRFYWAEWLAAIDESDPDRPS